MYIPREKSLSREKYNVTREIQKETYTRAKRPTKETYKGRQNMNLEIWSAEHKSAAEHNSAAKCVERDLQRSLNTSEENCKRDLHNSKET